MKKLESVSVFGLGKLGGCMAATFAARGLEVLGVDIDPVKVQRLNAGEPPVEEPLLAETIKEGRARLRATTRVEEAVTTDASFFIPPSPSLPDGSFDNSYLMKAMQPMARCVREAGKQDHLFVISSTTTPGATRQVFIPMLEQELGGRCGKEFGLCYNPEFIALGNVIRGLLGPDLVLIGESDRESGDRLEALYRRYNTNEPTIARMSPTSAELTKISVNSYITMKISFTNQLRLIAEALPDANIADILTAVGSDRRIGKAYLQPGLSFGGPCFPRDNRLVAYTAKQIGGTAPLAEASDQVNETTKDRLAEQVLAATAPEDQVAVLGMAYKPDTYLVEESAGLHLAQRLHRAGRRVLVHDFWANPSNSPALLEFEVLSGVGQLGQHEDLKLVVICCPSPGYRGLEISPGVGLLDPWAAA
jgi:UDPglucose 6-dehydrogenase